MRFAYADPPYLGMCGKFYGHRHDAPWDCWDKLVTHQQLVDYLVAEEFAREPEDILWRRSKLGLHGGAALADALAIHLAKLQSGGQQTGAAPAQAQGGRA